MAGRFNWGRGDDDVPEELKGMSQEDIVAAVKASKSQSKDIEGLKTELASTKSAFESFSSDFDTRLESKLREVMQSAPPTRQQESSNETKPPAFTDFLVDPEKATNERIAVALQPLAGITLQNAAYSAKNAAREKFQRTQRSNPGKNFDGYFFDKFESEIDTLSARMPAAQLANPETWEHLYFNVKGRHTDEISAQVREGKADFMIDPGTTTRQQDAPQDDKLTDQELKIAGKLGMDPKAYLESKKKIAASSIGVNL